MSSPLQKKETMKVPEPTLRRLPWYLSNVKLLKTKGGTIRIIHPDFQGKSILMLHRLPKTFRMSISRDVRV